MDKLELQMPVVVRADEIEICIFEIRDHTASLRFGFLRADHTLAHAEQKTLTFCICQRGLVCEAICVPFILKNEPTLETLISGVGSFCDCLL